MNFFHIFFPAAFILTLILSWVFVKIFRKFLSYLGVRFLFQILYTSVHIHEICHYLMALLMFKWPKYQGVEVKPTQKGFQIHGGVQIKVFSYKTLIYNIVNGSFVLETLYLVHQLIASFFIGLAPVIIPYSMLFFFFSKQGINFEVFDIATSLKIINFWEYIILIPFFFFGSIIASPSWADMKQSLPLFIFLFLIPIPFGIIDFLFFFSLLLFFGILLLLIIWLAVFLAKGIIKK